jgi:CRISPR-associated endonuclease Csn1
MKKILGLDLGTNSIGWALVNEAENESEKSSIIKLT